MAQRADTVLVIDDDAAVRALLSRLVELFGFRAVQASHGLAGLRLFQSERERIACVLLDAVMPVMDGVSTLCELRKANVGVPVFVVSGHDQGELAKQFSACPPDRFIPKPCDGATLFRVFSDWGVTPPVAAAAVPAAS